MALPGSARLVAAGLALASLSTRAIALDAAAPGDSFVCYVAPSHQVFIRFLIDPLQTSANRRRIRRRST